jgi:hypothetical protein
MNTADNNDNDIMTDPEADPMAEWFTQDKPIEATVHGIEAIKECVANKTAFTFVWDRKGRLLVDMQTANCIMLVYDALNDDNKAKTERMIKKSRGTFLKIVDICWKSVK